MNTVTAWSELVAACRTLGVELEFHAYSIRLDCAVNGNGVALSLKDACDVFLRAEYRLVLPLGELSINVGGISRLKSAYEIADLSGIGFGIALMTDRGVGVTLATLQQRYRHLGNLSRAAFHTRARRFGDLIWEVPSGLRLFKSYILHEGSSAGQQGYRRRAGRTCLLVLGEKSGHKMSNDVSLVFQLLARACLQEAELCHGGVGDVTGAWLRVLQIPASEERPPNRRAASTENGARAGSASDDGKVHRRGKPVRSRHRAVWKNLGLNFADDLLDEE